MLSIFAVAVLVSAVDTAETELSFEERLATERHQAMEESMRKILSRLRKSRTREGMKNVLPELVELAQAADRNGAYDIALTGFQQAAPMLKGPNVGLEEYLAWKVKDLQDKAAASKRLKPGSPEMGEFLCENGNWEDGLPLLANEPKYKEVIDRELVTKPVTTEEIVALADAWVAIGRAGSKLAYKRAGYWYKIALFELSGDEATALEKRIYPLQSKIDWWGIPGKPVEFEDIANCSFSAFDGVSTMVLTGRHHGRRDSWKLYYGTSQKYHVRNGHFGVWGIDAPSQQCRMYVGGVQCGLAEGYSNWIDCRVGGYKGRYILYDVYVRYVLSQSNVVIEGPWTGKKFIGTKWVQR